MFESFRVAVASESSGTGLQNAAKRRTRECRDRAMQKDIPELNFASALERMFVQNNSFGLVVLPTVYFM